MFNKPVVFVCNANYASMEAVVEAVFQRFHFNFKDKLVWVKPNLLGNFRPEKHVTTHPALVSAVVKKLLSLKANVIVGDNPGMGTIISENRVVKESGVLEASHGMFKIISQEISNKSIERNGIAETVAVSKIVDDCDFFISLPKMKTHLHTFLTGGVKNSYGMVVGVQKLNLHLKYSRRNDFAKLIAEIYNLRKPDLIIMDGVVAMEGDGPNCLSLREVNRVIASTDGVALDHYVATIMGMDIQRVPLLAYCTKNGIGSGNYIVEGNDSLIENFLLPKTYFDPSETNQTFLEVAISRWVAKKKLIINKDLCTKCLSCFNVCPAGAITLNDYPQIDSNKCILCYCCKENCQDNSITFSWSYKISQKILTWLENIRNR